MANCTVCSDVLLRHIRSGQTYWFCRRCRVEIMELTDLINPGNSVNSLLSSPEEVVSTTHHAVAVSESALPHPSARS